jgi:hypothetical protein
VPERQRAVPIGEQTERRAWGANARRESEAGSRVGEGREAEGEEREKSGEVAAMAGKEAELLTGRAYAVILSGPTSFEGRWIRLYAVNTTRRAAMAPVGVDLILFWRSGT